VDPRVLPEPAERSEEADARQLHQFPSGAVQTQKKTNLIEAKPNSFARPLRQVPNKHKTKGAVLGRYKTRAR
jgi:hypothetical protein